MNTFLGILNYVLFGILVISSLCLILGLINPKIVKKIFRINNKKFGRGKVLIVFGLICVLMPIIGVEVTKIQEKNKSDKKTSISIKEAKKMVDSDGFSLSLDDLTQISTEVANELAKLNGSVSLYGLKQISPDIAKGLASGNLQAISLDGLSELLPDVAKELVKSEKLEILSLNGLKTIDLETAKNLTKFKGKYIIISFDAIHNINIDVNNMLPKLIISDELEAMLAFSEISFENEKKLYSYLPDDTLFQKIFGSSDKQFIDKREVYDDGNFLVFRDRYCCTTGGDRVSFLVKRNKDKSYSILLNNTGQNTDGSNYGNGTSEEKVDCQKLKDQGVTNNVFKKYVELIIGTYDYMNFKSAEEICPNL